MASPLEVSNTGSCSDGSMLESALAYAAKGMAVFPLHFPVTPGRCSCAKGTECKLAGKHPMTRRGFKDASKDAACIRKWWTEHPRANIGLATGAISGIVVLDIDGDTGEKSLGAMCEPNGPVPQTLTVRTGRGRHLYFLHPGGAVKSRAPISPEYPNLDVRGDGGYVVAAPSVHASGRVYQTNSEGVAAPTTAPGWLLAVVAGSRTRKDRRANRAANDDEVAGAGSNVRKDRRAIDGANDEAFREGGRNHALTRLAGRMRYAAASEFEIASALHAFNASRCQPPLEDDEVEGIARSVASYVPGSPDDVRRTLTDVGNAKRFATAKAEHVRFVAEHGRWILWDGSRWEYDKPRRVVELAKEVVDGIYAEGLDVTDADLRSDIARHSKGSAALARIKAMLELAQSDPRVAVLASQLDAHQGWLGLQNGTLDLSSGRVREAAREDLITKLSPVQFDESASCPAWMKFLDTVMCGDTGLTSYLQRVVGYSISGYTEAQVLFFLYGSGANGKTTFVNVLRDLLGSDLAKALPSAAIASRKPQQGPTPELARLAGARVAIANEVEEGAQLDESTIKQLTGGDAIYVRELYSSAFDLVPQFKLFIVGNHMPVIRGTDHGIWRRIHLVPFLATIPESARDASLPAQLRDELPGILNWAVAGHRHWRELGLAPPLAVTDAITSYRKEMDILGMWLDEACEIGEGLVTRASDAYSSYRLWALANGHYPWTGKGFGRSLSERYGRYRDSAGHFYRGFKARP